MKLLLTLHHKFSFDTDDFDQETLQETFDSLFGEGIGVEKATNTQLLKVIEELLKENFDDIIDLCDITHEDITITEVK